MSVITGHPAVPYAWSLALHAAVVAGFMALAARPQPDAVMPLPIEAIVIDSAVLEALDEVRREDEARARQAAERAERRQREEQARREQEQLEQERVATATRERRQAEARVRAQAEAESQRRRDAEAAAARRREREQAEARRRAEAQAAELSERRRQEDAARAQREAELRARLAVEERRTAALAGGLRGEYAALIRARIQRNWIRPASAQAGLKCTIHVTQIPGGEVVGATLGACNGDAAVRQSIITAVLRSSPLPAPPDPTLFERNLTIEFVPED